MKRMVWAQMSRGTKRFLVAAAVVLLIAGGLVLAIRLSGATYSSAEDVFQDLEPLGLAECLAPGSEIQFLGRMFGGEVDGKDVDQLTCLSEDQEEYAWVIVFTEGTPPSTDEIREQMDRLTFENTEVVVGRNWIVLTSAQTADE